MRRLLVLAAVLCALASTAALAATRNGVTPGAPKKGATVKAGTRPTFTGKVTGPGRVFVYVSHKRKTDADGLLKPGKDEMLQEAKVKKERFTVKAKLFGYPEWWLNDPGTYYWQAHRVACSAGDSSDCVQEGPIVKFKVG